MKKTPCCLGLTILCSGLFAQTFPVETIFENGATVNRINLVFLSDGYKANELGKYITDVNRVLDDIFIQSPFKEYKTYFNAYAIKVPSAESGANHPQNTTDGDCLPVPQLTIDNYFGSTFDVGGIHRLLAPTNTASLSSVLADNFPTYDQAFVLVNSPYYGGSGGHFATASTESSSSEVAIHEIGHSFAFLADEYWAGAVYAAEHANLTKENDPSKIKWKNWLNTNDVGIYPHAEDPSWYRPHQNCKMRFLNVPFCSVCRETFVERIHNFVNPFIDYSPVESTLELQDGTIDFSVELLKPVPSTFKITWKKNNVIMASNQDKEQIAMPVSSFLTGSNTIQVEIIDTTALTRSDTHLINHFYVVTWTINTGHVTGIEVVSAKAEYEISIFPNPVIEELYLSYTLSRASEVNITFSDAYGKHIKRLVDSRQPAGKHDYHLRPSELNMSNSGLYYITLNINGVQVVEKLIRN